MYDLRTHGGDRHRAESVALSRGWRSPVIGVRGIAIGRRYTFLRVLWGVIAVASGCQPKMTAPRVTEAVEAPVTEVWVDGSATPGGNCSSDHPYRDLKAALAPGALIHLAAGIYPGPITLPDGAALISKNGTGVISLEGSGAVMTAGRGRLEGLSIQGGEVEVVNEEPLRRELADFVDAVVSKRAPTVDGAQGRRALALAQQITDRMATEHVATKTRKHET